MKFLVGVPLILAAAWLLVRLTTIEKVQRERARLEDQHGPLTRYRQAGVR